MVAVLAPAAQKQGYTPDAVVCASDVPAGRPYPWMCYLNAVKLQTYPLEAMVKIGDTINDIQEGLNAGMWTIGVTQSGNELGMTRQQVEQLEPPDLRRRLADIEQRFKTAGAHYVADGIWQCVPIVDEINQRLARGERPLPAG
jgi:phosphonoacetaldehyde hydrolase